MMKVIVHPCSGSPVTVYGFTFVCRDSTWWVEVYRKQLHQVLGFTKSSAPVIIRRLMRRGKAERVGYGKYLVSQDTNVFRRVLHLLKANGVELRLRCTRYRWVHA